ncbi:hypothetical protein [Nocardiopsis sp. NPDC006938]|uniref:hypothetical protein n=1 Tax=Nocardiopsis sp. NPDC006938 TaxID=3364337 RepID=UPI0036BAD0D7
MTPPPQHAHTNAVPSSPKTAGARGYWWAGALALVSALLFGAAYLFSQNANFPEPDIVERLGNGERTTFEVEAESDGEWAAYHSLGGHASMPCTLHGPGGEATWPRTNYGSPAPAFGGWGAVGILETPQAGTYTLACSGTSEEYAIGGSGPIRMVDPTYDVLQVTALGVVPLLLVSAVAVAVVTTVRRRAAAPTPRLPHQN